MGKLFRLDNPLLGKLSVLADLLIVNLLFILCSLPVVTIGAAFAGLQRVCMDKALDDEETVIGPFFKAFKDNFKQITIAFFSYLVINLAILWYFFYVPQLVSGIQLNIVYGAAAILMVIVNGVWAYLLPLIVRYDNKLNEHLKNAVMLSIAFLPKTLVLVAFALIPLGMALFSVEIFIKTFILWILIGFSLIRFISCIIIKPVIKSLERNEEDDNNTDS